jgi:hypothetical protein
MFDETPAINFSNRATVMPQIQKEKGTDVRRVFD